MKKQRGRPPHEPVSQVERDEFLTGKNREPETKDLWRLKNNYEDALLDAIDLARNPFDLE